MQQMISWTYFLLGTLYTYPEPDSGATLTCPYQYDLRIVTPFFLQSAHSLRLFGKSILLKLHSMILASDGLQHSSRKFQPLRKVWQQALVCTAEASWQTCWSPYLILTQIKKKPLKILYKSLY